MNPLRPAAAAVIVTALLAVPAQADHNRNRGIFVEPFFVPVPEVPFRLNPRRRDGYPVALVRKRLRGIGFYEIGRFDVYPSAYGVEATDPGGVRVRLAIDRWTGDIVRARIVTPGRRARPNRPPAVVKRAPKAKHKTVALRVPPLPRPAPERLAELASVVPPSAEDRHEPEKSPLPAAEDDAIVTSSTSPAHQVPEIDPIAEPDAMVPTLPDATAEDIVTSSTSRPVEAPEIDPIAKPDAMQPSLPDTEAKETSLEPDRPADIAALPMPQAIAGTAEEAAAVAPPPAVPSKSPVRPVTALQGERFDPADGRGPIADY